MRVAVTGASGMLGSAVLRQLAGRFDIFANARTPVYDNTNITWNCFDLTDSKLLQNWLKLNLPDIIVHCAANVNVDSCEIDNITTTALHIDSTSILANYCERFSKKLIYISTDSVFNGKLDRAYTEDDYPDPLNHYAKTKYLGEGPVIECSRGIVLRTNILGWGSGKKLTFFEWLLKGLQSETILPLFDDVFFSPITVEQCAFLIESLLSKDINGLFHCGSHNSVSKYEFGLLTAKIFHLPHTHILAAGIDTFGFDASRPKNMSLNCDKLEEALKIVLPTVKSTILELHNQYTSNADIIRRI